MSWKPPAQDATTGPVARLTFHAVPRRVQFCQARVFEAEGVIERRRSRLLDVGCGGGVLSEEFTRAGFAVTGVDPASESVEAARAHASASGLDIEYQTGAGEQLTFPDESFDCAACCDVLEHVDDVDRVIGEIARVLRPGGLFFYDTINRTVISRIAIIKIMQEWPSTAFAAPDSHVWEKFIRPDELMALL